MAGISEVLKIDGFVGILPRDSCHWNCPSDPAGAVTQFLYSLAEIAWDLKKYLKTRTCILSFLKK